MAKGKRRLLLARVVPTDKTLPQIEGGDMPRIEHLPNGLWSVVSDCGNIVRTDLTNSQAWRVCDQISSEAVSLSEAASGFKDAAPKPSVIEKQVFYSGLIQIAMDRGYDRGWAWHKFHDRFGFVPTGLHSRPEKPTKQVWGWLNRKAIKRKVRA